MKEWHGVYVEDAISPRTEAPEFQTLQVGRQVFSLDSVEKNTKEGTKGVPGQPQDQGGGSVKSFRTEKVS